MSTPIRKPPKKPKGLRRVSKKRAKVNRLRGALVKEVLHVDPMCRAETLAWFNVKQEGMNLLGMPAFLASLECKSPSTQVHEPRTRARFPGSDTILDRENCVAVCANCHRQIHDNVALSEACGLLVKSHG